MSEVIPDKVEKYMDSLGICCWKCNPAASIMILCRECGCKRCPKASDHTIECTKSNKSGQKGSVYT